MNEIGKLQLIYIRLLTRETERIRTLNDYNELTINDLNEYIQNLSEIDEYCKKIIENKNLNLENIEEIEEIEEVLFFYFYNNINQS